MLSKPVHLSTKVLVTIGLFDLITSLLLFRLGFTESNPIFRRLLEYGTWAFIGGKVLMLAGPVLLLEYVRTTHPKSAEQGTWIAAIAYLTLYVLHIVQVLNL